jgi:hypothetical protein
MSFCLRLCQSAAFTVRRVLWKVAYTAYSATPIGLTSETAVLGDFTPSVVGRSMPFWRCGGGERVLFDVHRRWTTCVAAQLM